MHPIFVGRNTTRQGQGAVQITECEASWDHTWGQFQLKRRGGIWRDLVSQRCGHASVSSLRPLAGQ